MTAIIFRIIKQMTNDKRSLALMLAAPVLLLILTYLLLSDIEYVPQIAVTQDIPEAFTTALTAGGADVIRAGNADFKDLLGNEEVDAIIFMDNNTLKIMMLEPDSVKVGSVNSAIADALKPSNQGVMRTEIAFLHGSDEDTAFDRYGYMLMGLLSFFFVFLISGIAFVRERTSGTLERLMLTPIKRWQIAAGYTVGMGIFSSIQSIIIVLFVRYALNFEFAGSVLIVMLIMLILALTATSTGALISVFANNEFQVIQFIPLVIVPQAFLSGLIPREGLPGPLAYLAYIMPVYYGNEALKHVIVRGESIGQIYFYIIALFTIAVVLFAANTLILKRYRRL